MRFQNFKLQVALFLVLFFVFLGTGCTVRTYKVIKDRPDIEVTGNEGYLLGGPKEKGVVEKTTRATYTMEIELGQPINENINSEEVVYTQELEKETPELAQIEENTQAQIIEVEKSPRVRTYTVQKGDTIEKIAARPEIYGDRKKWYKIYKANKDKLKSPDKIFPGQVLQIPE